MSSINKISNNNLYTYFNNNNLSETIENAVDNDLNFNDFLVNSLNDLNDKYLALDEAQKLFSQGNIEAHELMSILRETELMLKTATTIRNKVLDAYKEITNMQI